MTAQQARLAGLSGRATIRRDGYGVPHIAAGSDADGFRALGWAMAADRLFQMDMNRRTILGRLGELIATPGTLASDRMFRTLGIADVAAGMRALIPGDHGELLEAFTAGVNDWLAAHPVRREAEYQLLKIEQVEAWEPEHSLAIIRLIGWQLSGDFDKEMFGQRLVDGLAPGVVALLFPDIPAADVRRTLRTRWPASDGDPAFDLAREAPETLGQADHGTNIWVLDGSRTVNGRPLLANDPHLQLYAPGVWYEASLYTPNFRVSGFTFPGMPMIAIGHNEDLAWGASNWPADTQDVFRARTSGGSTYPGPDGTTCDIVERIEELHRRGEEPVGHVVRTSPHGVAVGASDHETLFLQWTGLFPSDEFSCFLNAARATSVEAFLEAMRDFGCPTQNFYVIDRHGQIGGIHAGRVPLRRRGESSLPQDAAAPEAQWHGWIDPTEFGPRIGSASGWLANANNKPVEASSGAPTGCRFTPPLRYRRILDLLASRTDWTPESAGAMQADTLNLAAVQQLAALHKRAAGVDFDWPDPALGAAWTRMLTWSGDHRDDPVATTLWHLFAHEMARLLVAPLIGPDLWFSFQDHHDPLHLLLLDWLSDPVHSLIVLAEGPADFGLIARNAFQIAYHDAVQLWGEDPAAWKWPEVHAIRLQHPLRLPVGTPEGIREPHPGGRHTLNVGNFSTSQGWWCNHGVSLRFIAWIDDEGHVRSRSLVMPGGSGDPQSPHFLDQLPLWRRNALRERPFGPAETADLPLEIEFLPDFL